MKGTGEWSADVCVPPSTIIPFHRHVRFAGPIGFLHAKPEEAYFLFRAMYTR